MPTFAHECENTLRAMWDRIGGGAEVTVSTQPPLVAGPHTTDGFRCPHGITYWVEPTGDQIARCARDGVR